MSRRVVYLLHFNQRFHHAQHYLGSTDDLGRRLAQHQRGDGAKLMAAVSQAGISFQVAKIWRGGRLLERQLKKKHAGPRLCPICRGEVVAPHASLVPGEPGEDLPY